MAPFAKVFASLVVIVALAGCTRSANQETTNSPSVDTVPSVTDTVPAGDQSTVEVTLSEYAFEPETIQLTAGVSNTIILTNVGSIAHVFAVPDLGIDVDVPAGGTQSVTVESPAAGTYELMCTIAGHEALGMHGSVVVQ